MYVSPPYTYIYMYTNTHKAKTKPVAAILMDMPTQLLGISAHYIVKYAELVQTNLPEAGLKQTDTQRHTDAHRHVHIDTDTQMQTHRHIQMHTGTCTSKQAHIHIYIHTRMHTYVHTQAYTYKNKHTHMTYIIVIMLNIRMHANCKC